MGAAGLTHGGFYRHFDSREHLVPEAAQRALSQAAHGPWRPAKAGGGVLPWLVDGYHSAWPRDYPESGCGVAGIAADVARADGLARAAYTHQAQVCLAVPADLIDNADRKVGEREAILSLSVLVGAISMAPADTDQCRRRVETADPELVT